MPSFARLPFWIRCAFVALALTLGAALGGAIQVGQELRSASSLHGIDKINKANFMLSLLLPETSHPARVVDSLDFEQGCLVCIEFAFASLAVPIAAFVRSRLPQDLPA